MIPNWHFFFVNIMSMMCTLSMRQTNRKVRTATQYFRSLWRTEESMLWRYCRSLVKEWLSLGHMTWKRLENKKKKIRWNFNFTRINHWYQMKEALKSTARRSFGQCTSALVWEWIHLLTRHGGSYKKVVFPHKLFIQIKTSSKLQCKKVYNLCWVLCYNSAWV